MEKAPADSQIDEGSPSAHKLSIDIAVEIRPINQIVERASLHNQLSKVSTDQSLADFLSRRENSE